MTSRVRLYVGNLPPDANQRELDELFRKYGRIVDISIKQSGPTAFAFVLFEDERDAEDARRGRDGREFGGHRLRVEFAQGDREGRGAPKAKSQWRLIVNGLPRGCGWQELKDLMREAGAVQYTDVRYDGTGLVEFIEESALLYALKNLQGVRLVSKQGDSARIRLREETQRERSPGALDRVGDRRTDDRRGGGDNRDRRGGEDRHRDRSPPRSRDAAPRSPQRSPPRTHSPARGRSPPRGRSPARARSPVRDPSPVRHRSPVRSPARGRSPARARSPARSPVRAHSPVRSPARSPVRGRSPVRDRSPASERKAERGSSAERVMHEDRGSGRRGRDSDD